MSAAIRLLKPLSYFAEKYGTPEWAFNKLFLLMEKQHNRGQDGAGIGCIKLNMPLGDPYIFRARDISASAVTNLFSNQQRNLRRMRDEGTIKGTDSQSYKQNFNFGGEVLMGHLLYGTSGQTPEEGICHPYMRRTNWPTRTLMMQGNMGITNISELHEKLISRGQHPVFGTDIQTLERLKKFFLGLGFGQVVFTTAEEHDQVIAYTSQLPHVVASAYVRSPLMLGHHGFSAGSFRDLTRVAYLDPDMWTELFMENSDNVLTELDLVISALTKYKDAISSGDRDTLRDLLAEGRLMKEESMKVTSAQNTDK